MAFSEVSIRVRGDGNVVEVLAAVIDGDINLYSVERSGMASMTMSRSSGVPRPGRALRRRPGWLSFDVSE